LLPDCITQDAKRVKQDEPAQSAQPDKQPTPQASTGQAGEASADAPSGSDRKLLPVTLLSGFLGTGKTTLLKQILQNKDNMKIAVIVNDMGAINLDASEIKKHKLIQEKEEMVELQNGCICCTLRGDLLKTVKRLSDSDEEYDHLVIESTGIAEPLPVAQTFVMDVNGDGQFHDDDQQMFSAGKQAEHAHGEGHAAGEEGDTQLEVMDGEGATSKHDPLSDYARMDTLVTVVDAFNVLGTMSSIETLADRQRLIGDEEADQEKSAQLVAAGMAPSSVVQLLLDQIEFANVILLNKIDLIPKRKRESVVAQVQSLLRKLNPSAKVLVPELPKFKDFDVSQILNTNLFDMEAAQTSAGWIAELQTPMGRRMPANAGRFHLPLCTPCSVTMLSACTAAASRTRGPLLPGHGQLRPSHQHATPPQSLAKHLMLGTQCTDPSLSLSPSLPPQTLPALQPPGHSRAPCSNNSRARLCVQLRRGCQPRP